MSKWKLEFKEEAVDDLDRLSNQLRLRVIGRLEWLVANFDQIAPLPLSGPWKGLFKLRIGDWRVIYGVNFSRKIISVYYIDRRDKIYKLKR